MNALSGQQTVLAKPPHSVSAVMPRGLAAIHAAKRGEDCIVKACAHSETNQHPGQQINRQRVRKTHKREACGIE
jgi:hypothetical protein